MLILAIGCQRRPALDLDDIAKGYVRAALQLAQHQPSLVEAWRGDAAWRPGARVPVAETRRDIASLTSALTAADRAETSSTDRGRADYLRRQLAALDLSARRLLGEPMPFAEEIVAAYGTTFPAADDAALRAARLALGRLLPGTGSLGERHAAFRRSMTIPRERRADVLAAALDACRGRTRAHIALPADESLDLRVGVDSIWDGFARYHGGHRSIVEISGRSPLDVSRALRLACHEAYPGHHVQDVLLDTLAVSGHRPELLLQPAFGPHLLIAEGAAEAGADLAFSRGDRARVYRDVLLPLAGLPIDRADHVIAVETEVLTLEGAIPGILATYLDSGTSRDAALEALANDAAVMDSETLLGFAEQQRTRAIAYVLGRQVVGTWLMMRRGNEWNALAALFSTRAFVLD